MAGHAFFYLRDPAWARAQPASEQATYLEAASPEEVAELGPDEAEARAAARRQQLADLKDRILTSGFPVVDGYADPVALGPHVLDDLGTLVDQLFPVDQPADPLDRSLAEHEAYAAARFGLHVGGDADRAALHAHLAAGGPPLLVVGAPGTGKSALLATWAAEVAAAEGAPLVVTHFAGASSEAADPAALSRRLIGEVARGTGAASDPDELPTEPDALRTALTDALRRAGEQRSVVLVLDGLDQLDDRDHAPDLAFLPFELPAQVHLVASAVGGRPLDAAQARGWATHTVSPLTGADRRELVAAFLARSSKRLGPDLTDRLVAHPSTANPLFLRTVLDELRQHGDHFTLGDVIDAHLAAPDLAGLFAAVLGRWERDFERDRPGLVRDALTALWAARRGLTEPELLDVLGGDDPLPHAFWSPLFLAAGESLALRAGLLGFLHEPLRTAVAARWLPTPADQTAAHQRLAAYFDARPLGPRVVAELPWQLQRAEAWDALADVLARPDLLAAAYRADLPGVRAAWTAVEGASDRRMTDAYADVLADPSAHPDRTWEIARLLTDAGHPTEALALHQHLVERARAEDDRRGLAGALANLGAAQMGGDDIDDALVAFAEAEEIARAVGDDGLLQVALGNQGAALRARADHRGALAKMVEEEAICRRLGDLAGLQSSLGNQGAVALDQRDYATATARFDEQERVARQLGDATLVNRALANQAQVLADRGDPEAALALLARQEHECRRHGDWAGLAANLVSRASVLLFQGRFPEAETAAAEGADLARRLSSESTLARTLFLRATIAHQRGDRAGALALLDEHRPLVEALGDRSGLALALGERATLEREAGDPSAALALHAEEQRLYTELGDRSGVATSLSNQGLARHALGDPAGAAALLAQAEAIIRELELPALLQVTLGNRAAFLLQAGDVAGAATALAEQEAICRQTGNRVGLAACLGNQALVAQQHGNGAAMLSLLTEQERICREVGDRPGLVNALGNLVTCAVAANDAPGALRHLDAQLAEARQLGPQGSATVVTNLTVQMRMRPALGDLAGLHALLIDVEGTSRTQGDDAVVAQCLAIRATMAMGSGDVATATPLLLEAEDRARRSGNAHALQLAIGNRGLLALQQGQLDVAEPLLLEQEAVSRAAGSPEGLSAALGNLAIVAQHRGDAARSLALLTEQEQLCRQTGDVQSLVLALANRGEVTSRQPGRRAEGLALLDEATAVANQIGWAPMAAQIQQLAAQVRALPGS
jgi:ATP/maltotriose-dependent transcriptional regulator MalT